MKILRCLIILFVITNLQVFPQKLDNPLLPIDNTALVSYLGMQLGVGQNWQNGSFLVNCQDCKFNGGVGTGLEFALYYDREAISKTLNYGISLGVNTKTIESKFKENEMLDFDLPDGSYYGTFPVLMNNTAKMSLTYASFIPYLKYKPFAFLSFRAGPSFSIPISNNVTHHQEPAKSTLTLENGSTARIRSQNNVIENGEVKALNKMLLGLDLQAAVTFHLGNRVTFAPVFAFNLPFGNTSSYGDSYTISTWRLLLEFNYQLQKRGEPKP